VFYVVYRKMSNAFAMSWRVQVSFSFDDDVRFALEAEQLVRLTLFSAT
jgi:hypothetical protein